MGVTVGVVVGRETVADERDRGDGGHRRTVHLTGVADPSGRRRRGWRRFLARSLGNRGDLRRCVVKLVTQGGDRLEFHESARETATTPDSALQLTRPVVEHEVSEDGGDETERDDAGRDAVPAENGQVVAVEVAHHPFHRDKGGDEGGDDADDRGAGAERIGDP